MRITDRNGIYKIKYKDLYFCKKQITRKSFFDCYIGDVTITLYDFEYDYKIYSIQSQEKEFMYKVSLTDTVEEASRFTFDEIEVIQMQKWFQPFGLYSEFISC